jgi:hypothetical protein
MSTTFGLRNGYCARRTEKIHHSSYTATQVIFHIGQAIPQDIKYSAQVVWQLLYKVGRHRKEARGGYSSDIVIVVSQAEEKADLVCSMS